VRVGLLRVSLGVNGPPRGFNSKRRIAAMPLRCSASPLIGVRHAAVHPTTRLRLRSASYGGPFLIREARIELRMESAWVLVLAPLHKRLSALSALREREGGPQPAPTTMMGRSRAFRLVTRPRPITWRA